MPNFNFISNRIIICCLLAFLSGNIFAQKSGCFSMIGGSRTDYLTIYPCNAKKITLTIYYFGVSNGSYLKVYDGYNAIGKALHPGSGFTYGNIPSSPIVANSGALYLYFTTNGTSSSDSIFGCWTAVIDTAKPVANFESEDTLFYLAQNTFVNTTKNVLGKTDYVWSIEPGFGEVGYSKDMKWMFTQTGKYNVTLEATSCMGNSRKVRPITVIKPEDKVNLDFKAKKTQLYITDLDTLYAINFLTRKRPVTADRFRWEISPNTFTYENGTTAYSEIIQVKFKDKGKYKVTLIAWNSSDSASTVSVVIKKDFIIVKGPLIKNVYLDIIAKNLKPQIGLFDTLYAIDSIDGRMYKANKFKWEFSPNTVTYVNATSPEMKEIKVKFNEIGKYTVSLIGWHSSDSLATVNDTIKIDFITVLDLPFTKLKLDFFANKTKLKTNEIAILNVSDSIDGQPLKANKFRWEFVPNEVTFVNGSSSSSKTIEVKFKKKGQYTVSLSAWNDVDSVNSFNDTFKSNYLVVKDPSEEKVYVNFKASNLSPQISQVDTLLALDSGDGRLFKADRFKWEFTPNTVFYINGTTSEMKTIQVIFSEAIKYDVRLSAWNSADSSGTFNSAFKLDYISVVKPTSIKRNLTADIMVYPNPSQGIFTFNYQLTESSIVQIYNSLGKVVYEGNVSENNPSIDLSQQPDGIYLMRLVNENNLFIEKLLILKSN